METLLSRHRNIITLIAVLFVQLIGLAYQVRRPDAEVPLVREWVAMVVTPPQRMATSVFRGIGGTWSNYIDLRGARRETSNLEDENSRLRVQNLELKEQILTMQRVQGLEAFRETSPSTLLLARVIGSGASDQSRVIFLNKGKPDGVRPDMAVITAEGVVGKVQRVFVGSSQVLLITDEESGVGALLETSRVHGVLHGQNALYCSLRYVLNDEKVEVGERLFTSGEDRVFPKGMPVGTVSAVETGSDFKKVTVLPAARLNRLEEVLIVLQGRELALPGRKDPVVTVPPAELAPAPAPEAKPAPTGSGGLPDVPHGARPETDADKIHSAYHAKTLQQNPPKPVVKPAAPGATGIQKPAVPN